MWALGGCAALLGSKATLRANAGIRSAGTRRQRIKPDPTAPLARCFAAACGSSQEGTRTHGCGLNPHFQTALSPSSRKKVGFGQRQGRAGLRLAGGSKPPWVRQRPEPRAFRPQRRPDVVVAVQRRLGVALVVAEVIRFLAGTHPPDRKSGDSPQTLAMRGSERPQTFCKSAGRCRVPTRTLFAQRLGALGSTRLESRRRCRAVPRRRSGPPT